LTSSVGTVDILKSNQASSPIPARTGRLSFLEFFGEFETLAEVSGTPTMIMTW